MSLLSSTAPPETSRKNGSVTTAVIAIAAVIALLYFGRAFMITLVTATIFAFLLEPPVAFFTRFRLPRALASFLVCSIALLLVYLGGLGIYSQISGLLEDLPKYSDRINGLVDKVAVEFETLEQNIYQTVVPKRIRDRDRAAQAAQAAQAEQAAQRKNSTRKRVPEPAPLPAPIPEVRLQREPTQLYAFAYDYLSSFYEALLMASFVPFLVYFMLSWRDHIRRGFLQFFEGEERLVAGRSWQGVADMVRAYVVGNFMLGLLLSLATTLIFFGMHLPYPLLLGPLSAFLSLVPYVGLPLAVIPAIVGALMTYDVIAPFLVLSMSVAFLHLLALNLLYPQMVGSRVHLNPLVVTVALMFWGTVWGGFGLVLAIPVTAGIKAVCDNVEGLQRYGRFLGD